jgi:hypothetical protein
LRLEFGDLGYILICTRSGSGGSQWAIDLFEEERQGGQWHHRAVIGQPKRLQWSDEEDEPVFDYVSQSAVRMNLPSNSAMPRKN